MSYKALYRKYRPTTFCEVKGQDHIIKTLKNIVLSHKISHAYLFSGPRGVGKTSVAKIFAGIVNCYHNNDDYTILCDKCSQNLTTNMDIIEMDAASNTGVDSIRELRDKIQHLPTLGRYKVYIIDEVHMLSKGAFNALLKTLEEPPTHVIFILATTDPQKIPLTILSRVQRFNFRRISNKVLEDQIQDILDKEKIEYDYEIVKYVARLATGGMRDALSIIEQASAYGNGKIHLEDITYSFGITTNDNVIKILNNLFNGNTKESLQIFNDLKEAGIEPKQFVETLINVVKDFIVYNRTLNIDLLEILNLEEIEELKIDLSYAMIVSEQLYKLTKEFFYVNNNLFQLIELYLLKIASINSNTDIANKEKPMIINDFEKDNKTSDVEKILSQTQEFVVENNEDTSEISLLEGDLLTNEFDVTGETYIDGGVIDTSEIDLNENITKDIIDVSKVPKYDEKYYSEKFEFFPKYTIKQLKDALLLSDRDMFIAATRAKESITQIINDKAYKDLINALNVLSLKAVGKNYIVFTSDNIPMMNYLQDVSNKQRVQTFFKDYFAEYKHILIFQKEIFKNVAKEVVEIIKQGDREQLKEAVNFDVVQVEKDKNPNKEIFDFLSEIK
ncbi:DNA polymerase III subunit gamma/tau [Mycoplasma sp. U97]|uniref:DNA polymerase III subunit gamma/tau n=1 Tax=Mycoplasma tauri TaxID=547987 RepID=UPI001CBC70BE|nr:DNA polymerase III subunit gamma/tau [Mycoplasma tauri]MBZ4212721.1 DNA polymerase III subunit gamma/tau [Mycoplasma tauri]